MFANPRFPLALLAGLLTLALAGCSGGGAGQTRDTTVAPAVVLATGTHPTLAESTRTSIPLAGNAVTITSAAGTTTVTPRANVVSARTIDSATQMTLAFAIDNVTRSAVVGLSVPAAGAGNGLGVPVFQATVSDGTVTTADSTAAGAAGVLDYASYGYWIFQPTDILGAPNGPAVSQSYFGGRETPVGNIPTTGSATYTGRTLGQGVTAGAAFFMAGDVTLTANFANSGLNARSISGGITNITSNLAVPPLGAVMPTSISLLAGAISGNGFAGTTTALSGASTIGSGTFSGKFFGPTAQEVSGAWAFQSPAGSPAVSAIGSFGAKQ